MRHLKLVVDNTQKDKTQNSDLRNPNIPEFDDDFDPFGFGMLDENIIRKGTLKRRARD